jgi:ADP-ribosylglycohydrolase
MKENNNKCIVTDNAIGINETKACNHAIGTLETVKAALFGVATGDALGVPVEFCSREELRENLVTEMIGGEDTTWRMPAGTWSDDSSLTFCLAEALTAKQLDLDELAFLFTQWLFNDYWTSTGKCFDVGRTTERAITRLAKGAPPYLSGETDERSNGNGSLMRILPLVFYIRDLDPKARFILTSRVSSLTHRHPRSIAACFYYLEFARKLLQGKDKFLIYMELQKEITNCLSDTYKDDELQHFSRLLKHNIFELSEEEIRSGVYVVETLEASVWCLLTTGSYEEAVTKAVNLGGDTDTTGAVTGGLAGLLYGFDAIPKRWLAQLARYDDITALCEKFDKVVNRVIPPHPITYSYEVEPGLLYAGEYPVEQDFTATKKKIRELLDFGINAFIDLTEMDECEPYEPLLPDDVVYFHFPIEDYTFAAVNDMLQIINRIEELTAAGRKVYVHCHAGIDRTGSVVAAWFAKHYQMTADEALAACINRWETNPKAKICVGTPIIQSEPEYIQRFIDYCF